MNFDKVEYDHPDGTRTLSPQEFSALSPVDRVKGIGQGRFRFYRNGVKITASEALRARERAS
jgi:hypothetical protein